jgi:hypothetical protein
VLPECRFGSEHDMHCHSACPEAEADEAEANASRFGIDTDTTRPCTHRKKERKKERRKKD